ncbi:MAG: sigma-70 family RNA polymerase sigma factor [Planctomycetota bacterium]
MSTTSSNEVTALLERVRSGNRDAVDQLLPLVYRELHELAERVLCNERRHHTLQPTALIHEAFLRLVKQDDVQWQGRSHFIAVASTAMRRILVDYARARVAQKRGAGYGRVALETVEVVQDESPDTDIPALDDALTRLAALDPRQARIVELRFFGGLGVEETAALLEISTATVKREWASAKAWLKREMNGPCSES